VNAHAPWSGEWAWLGRLPYVVAERLQAQVRDQVASGAAPDTFLLLEHEPVITLGRSADVTNVLATPEKLRQVGISVVRASRGGDVTYHGPGQLVGYPIFRLRRGVRSHVTSMADAIISTLGLMGIDAHWRESQPGVWVGDDKICAVGVRVQRRVATHGFALNVTTDLDAFRTIVPCGLRHTGITSMVKCLGTSIEIDKITHLLCREFARVFDMDLVEISASSSRLQIANENL